MSSFLRYNNKLFIRSCSFVMTIILTLCSCRGDDPFSFGSLFGENFDFGEFVKELEKELEQELGNEQQVAPPVPQWTPPAEIPPTKQSKQSQEVQKTDIKSRFLDPLAKKEGGSSSKQQQLEEVPYAKVTAYHHYMGTLVDNLRTIESAVLSGKLFSQGFKDRFMQSYKSSIDTLESEYELISSHDAYLAGFFSSNKDRSSLRQDIFALFESVDKIVQKIPAIKTEDIKASYERLKKIEVPLPKIDKVSTVERRKSIRQKKATRSSRRY